MTPIVRHDRRNPVQLNSESLCFFAKYNEAVHTNFSLKIAFSQTLSVS
jgi:hypothetical protein